MKSRHGLEVRAATSADIPGLCDLLRTTGLQVSPRVLGERLDAIRREPGAVLVAAAWGPPVGIALSHWHRTLNSDQATARITTLLVDPEERRRGIGRLLVKAAAQAARIAGCGALELTATPDERTLRDFCLATGFTERGAWFSRPLRKKAAA